MTKMSTTDIEKLKKEDRKERFRNIAYRAIELSEKDNLTEEEERELKLLVYKLYIEIKLKGWDFL